MVTPGVRLPRRRITAARRPKRLRAAPTGYGSASPCPCLSRLCAGVSTDRSALSSESKLEGIHHVTCITGDAPRNVEFYAGSLGLRLVKKTVNQDDPTVYHLFYADERASAGSDITFFEYPGAARGRAGDGMVHRIVFRVASEEALDFWAEQ